MSSITQAKNDYSEDSSGWPSTFLASSLAKASASDSRTNSFLPGILFRMFCALLNVAFSRSYFYRSILVTKANPCEINAGDAMSPKESPGLSR